jgi:hypothetical protein
LPARKQDRADLPDGEGLLPPSLLADVMSQIRCDAVSVEREKDV